MTIKVYLWAICEKGKSQSIYVALSLDEREKKVAKYCRNAWSSVFRVLEQPERDVDVIQEYFGWTNPNETLHYDTDWLRPEDFAACPNATVIGDSVLLTPTPI